MGDGASARGVEGRAQGESPPFPLFLGSGARVCVYKYNVSMYEHSKRAKVARLKYGRMLCRTKRGQYGPAEPSGER